MIALSPTKYGTKRRAIISGFAQWNHLNSFAEVLFYVQLIDANGNLLDDKSLNQNRVVIYPLSNYNKVDAQFNPINEGGTGEYDYFYNYTENPNGKTISQILIQLGNKLNERGIFN